MYKILIADDDMLTQEALRIMVAETSGFEVIQSVDTGEEAVDVCGKLTVDLLFIDMQMPGITGIEAARKIQVLNPDITIYVFASQAASLIIRNVLKDSVYHVIEKPVTNWQMKKILKHYETDHEDIARSQFAELSEILRNKDYKKFYDNIENIVVQIYEKADRNLAQLIKIFTYIGQNLFDAGNPYHDNRSITEMFPLNEGLIMEVKTTELWLFRIMDYLFRQNSINRYPLLSNIFLFIDNHIKEDISLNLITENCTISQGYLSRIFREQFQVSVTEYLHMKKLHLAKGYFYFTNKGIAEVAFCLGYNESSYFSKVFRKYENKTVKQYKNDSKKESAGADSCAGARSL